MIYGVGSMLIRRRVLECYLDQPFSHDFAFTGGSDLEFFTRCRRDGRGYQRGEAADLGKAAQHLKYLVLRPTLFQSFIRRGSEQKLQGKLN